jgi:LPS sulfotransferase NodH
MPIKQVFTYTMPDGTPGPTVEQWAEGLSAEDKQKFEDSKARQLASRQSLVEAGHLEVVGQSMPNKQPDYVFADRAAIDKKIEETDPEWLVFWNRYLEETGVQFTIKEEEI